MLPPSCWRVGRKTGSPTFPSDALALRALDNTSDLGKSDPDLMTMTAKPAGSHKPVGDLLREWRQRRRLSQLDLACEAEISTRHLSFVETGRAQPSREMVLHLAEQLDVPLRERNVLLVAAGYAPVFRERPLDDPALRRGAPGRRSGAEGPRALSGARGRPALDAGGRQRARSRRCWRASMPALLQPPVNVLRLSLHPRGLGAAHRQPGRVARAPARAAAPAGRRSPRDPALAALLEELQAYPGAERRTAGLGRDAIAGVVVPLQLRTEAGALLSLFSTTTVFGTPVDITLSELAIEAFFPADPGSAELLRHLHAPA